MPEQSEIISIVFRTYTMLYINVQLVRIYRVSRSEPIIKTQLGRQTLTWKTTQCQDRGQDHRG